MKRLLILFCATGLILVGCVVKDHPNSTKVKVYGNEWDGNPVIVEQGNNGDFEQINEITDRAEVAKLIKALKTVKWKENVEVDIRPADYRFTWNSYEHYVWVNEEYGRLELSIDGQSNYGTLSTDSSEIVFEILTGKEFVRNK